MSIEYWWTKHVKNTDIPIILIAFVENREIKSINRIQITLITEFTLKKKKTIKKKSKVVKNNYFPRTVKNGKQIFIIAQDHIYIFLIRTFFFVILPIDYSIYLLFNFGFSLKKKKKLIDPDRDLLISHERWSICEKQCTHHSSLS